MAVNNNIYLNDSLKIGPNYVMSEALSSPTSVKFDKYLTPVSGCDVHFSDGICFS